MPLETDTTLNYANCTVYNNLDGIKTMEKDHMV